MKSGNEGDGMAVDRRMFAFGLAPAAILAPSAALPAEPAAPDGVALRPFAQGDEAAVEALVAAQYDREEERRNGTFHGIRGLFLPGRSRRAGMVLVAEADGNVVGVGASAPPSNLHPVGRVHVIVAEGFRRRGIGTALYQPLHDKIVAGDAMPVAGLKGDEAAGYAFARRCGMQVLMRERHYFVDTRAWPVERWCANALARPADFELVRGDRLDPDRLWAALWGAYHESHKSFVPTFIRPAAFRSNMAAAIDPGRVVVAVKDGAAIGAAALLALRKEAPIAIYPCSASAPMAPPERERALVARLLADRILAARDAGHAEAMINAEDLDGRLMPVMTDVPVASLYEYYTMTAGRQTYWPRSAA